MYWNRHASPAVDYILVTDSEEDEADCWILKDLSGDGEEEAVYEMVEDDSELMAVSKVFQEMLDNVDISQCNEGGISF